MLKRLLLALVLVLSAAVAFAGEKKPGINISFSSEDDRTRIAPRHEPRDARLAITTREGSAMLLLTNDAVAVQLTDRALASLQTKPEAGLIEEIVASGVKAVIRKAVEVPISSIRGAEIRDGALVLTTDRNQPLFTEIKVNGTEVLRDFSVADAARFVNAVRAARR